jgi:hypothetical protein
MKEPQTKESEVKRIEVTKPMVGICHMQVCAVEDATDKEILEVCNRENLCGTTNGWINVIRENEDERFRPVQCDKHPGKNHFLVSC